MIGRLPKTLTVDGEIYDINSDYRAALTIFEALGDKTLSALNKSFVLLEIIYQFDIPANITEAQKQAVWFLDIGDKVKREEHIFTPQTMDYKQDEQLLFSAVGAVTGYDIREEEYLHWWSFYGMCQAISPDALLSHIVGIRDKQARGKKLNKSEQEFYTRNRHLIDMQASVDAYEEMVKQLRGE